MPATVAAHAPSFGRHRSDLPIPLLERSHRSIRPATSTPPNADAHAARLGPRRVMRTHGNMSPTQPHLRRSTQTLGHGAPQPREQLGARPSSAVRQRDPTPNVPHVQRRRPSRQPRVSPRRSARLQHDRILHRDDAALGLGEAQPVEGVHDAVHDARIRKVRAAVGHVRHRPVAADDETDRDAALEVRVAPEPLLVAETEAAEVLADDALDDLRRAADRSPASRPCGPAGTWFGASRRDGRGRSRSPGRCRCRRRGRSCRCCRGRCLRRDRRRPRRCRRGRDRPRRTSRRSASPHMLPHALTASLPSECRDPTGAVGAFGSPPRPC